MTLNPNRLTQLAWLAIVGQVILIASAWLLPSISEYGFVGDHVSELALGRLGAVQTAAFLIAGLGTLGLAVAIRQLTPGARGLVGSLLIGAYGAGAIGSAVFPTDRVEGSTDLSSLSATGTIHVAVVIVSFVSIVVAMFLLTWTFLRQPRWQPASWWWILFPGGALSLLIVQQEGPLIGLLQRLLVTVISAWLVLIALALVSSTSRSASTAGTSAGSPTTHQPVRRR